MSEREYLPHERIKGSIKDAFHLNDGEHVLHRQPFGWNLDGIKIPNMAEHFEPVEILPAIRMTMVGGYGDHIFIVKELHFSGGD